MRAIVPAFLALAYFAAPAAAQVPVNVESTPPGATVFLDSESDATRLGVTPLRSVRVARGVHTLIFKLANHEDARVQINVARRRETFRAVLNPLGVIDVTAGNAASAGAAVRIDGQPVGNVPHRQNVQPGRHLVQVGREGYVTYNQWTDVAGGQVVTLPVLLEAQAPSTGSLLVASDVSGAAVYVDGTPRGTTPTVIDGLTEGDHVVEVRSNDASQQPHRETIRVVAGQRTTVSATLRAAPAQNGTLRIIANAPGAVISVDGEVVGNAPATAANLAPGEHIVEARAEGYQPLQQPVTIEPGRQRVISLELRAVERAPGRIIVNANVGGAQVLVNNEDRGHVPVVLEGIPVGTYAIVVRAAGYEEHRETCTTGPGRDCQVTARLEPIGTLVRVEANAPGAVFVVDGEVRGPVPWEGNVAVGEHTIEVRAPGYRSHVERVSLRPSSEIRLVNVGLVAEGELSPEERLARETARRDHHRQAVARSGATLPNDLAVLDFSFGWPHLFEFRLGIGVLDWLEAGIGLRTTFYRLTEFEGRVKVGYRPVRQVSIGLNTRLGGGLGPGRQTTQEDFDSLVASGELDATDARPELSTNSFFFSIEALFSLHFLHAGNFTLWGALDYHTDQWQWNASDSDCRYSVRCEPGMDVPRDPDPDLERISGRQSLARFRLGGSLEFILGPRWNVWGSFEGILAGKQRRIFGDVWGFGRDDVMLYARLGFTYKFGYAERDDDPALPPPEPAAEPAPAPAAP
ncbi:MAG: PEGA domain-containing protein [Polyangiales bacterium]